VDGLVHRGDIEGAASVVSGISLLCPFLQRCSPEIGVSAEDALSVVGDHEVELLRQAAVYARFCQLMPEVRQGYYNVKAVKRGFRLAYKEQEYRRSEGYDFILHEVGKATDSSSLEMHSILFSQLVRQWPMWDLRVVNAAFDQLYAHHRQRIYEPPLLRLDAYQSAFGFTRDEFNSVRAALFALASFSNGMHLSAAKERDQSGDPRVIQKYQAKFLEWNTPILTKVRLSTLVSFAQRRCQNRRSRLCCRILFLTQQQAILTTQGMGIFLRYFYFKTASYSIRTLCGL
jgi:hypothetical protein